jgi:hypothetical protein
MGENGSRIGVVGFVTVGGRTEPRLFYRSKSQAVWSLSESLTLDASGNLRLYNKGYRESDIHLPIQLSSMLHRLGDAQPALGLPPAISSAAVIKGLCEIRPASMTYIDGGRRGLSTAYATTVSSRPEAFGLVVAGLPLHALNMNVVDPARVGLPPDAYLPNLNRVVDSFEYDNGVYGRVNGGRGALKGRVYRSKNGQYEYLFVEDADGRAALTSAERTGVAVSSFGVARRSLSLEGMDAPLMEYFFQQSVSDIPDALPAVGAREYRSNWNYVRRLPIIDYYYRGLGRAMPPALSTSAVTTAQLLIGYSSATRRAGETDLDVLTRIRPRFQDARSALPLAVLDGRIAAEQARLAALAAAAHAQALQDADAARARQRRRDRRDRAGDGRDAPRRENHYEDP